MKHRPVICILDNDKERCLREEKLLDELIREKRLAVSGIANYGGNYLARTGLERFPAVEVDGVYFTPGQEGELTRDRLNSFLDMLLHKGVIVYEGETSARKD